MSIDTIKQAIPEYAKDIKLNLSSLANDENLPSQQLWGSFLASAMACGNSFVIQNISKAASEHLSEEAITGAKSAASIMAMNNIYYRFAHLSSNKEYRTMPAGLRMNVIANPGVDKVDFELWSLVVSAINGCGMCIDSHEKQLLASGITKEQIQTSVKIASVVNAVSAVLTAESALSSASSE